MKNTGVVRRIDDLGRIVIPKEIRKSLRIKDGESLEIFLNSDNIVLKKYSPMQKISDFYTAYVEALHSELGNNIMITDRDRIVAVAGDLKKKYLRKVISSDLEKIIFDRSLASSKDLDSVSIIKDNSIEASYVIAPIIANGDTMGAIIILSTEDRIDDFIIKTCNICAKFLGKYIE